MPAIGANPYSPSGNHDGAFGRFGVPATRSRVCHVAADPLVGQAQGMTPDTPLVVIGVDGSECAREALRVAVDEARWRGARLHVVAAWTVPMMMYASGRVAGADPGTWEHAAELEAADAVEEVHRLAPDLDVVGDVSNAAPAPALLAAAAHADLLVVGSRGLGGFARLLLGSVSQHVATHAACAVLIVRPRET